MYLWIRRSSWEREYASGAVAGDRPSILSGYCSQKLALYPPTVGHRRSTVAYLNKKIVIYRCSIPLVENSALLPRGIHTWSRDFRSPMVLMPSTRIRIFSPVGNLM